MFKQDSLTRKQTTGNSSLVSTSASATHNKQLSSYYESLRTNVMSILGQVKVQPTSDMDTSSAAAAAVAAGITPDNLTPNKENFDSYLCKLQNICTENLSAEEASKYNQANYTQPAATANPAVFTTIGQMTHNPSSMPT